MREGPVYIAAMNMNGEYIPVMLGVIFEKSHYAIGFKKINGALSHVYTYHYRDEREFDDEEDAQSALNELAKAHGWKPYEKLRRY